MDDQFDAVRGDEHDGLQQVASGVRTDDEPPIGIVADVIDDHGMLDSVANVFVADAVAPGGLVNLHTWILYYKTVKATQRLFGGGGVGNAQDRWSYDLKSMTPVDLHHPRGVDGGCG